jgi:hypothetical protein
MCGRNKVKEKMEWGMKMLRERFSMDFRALWSSVTFHVLYSVPRYFKDCKV